MMEYEEYLENKNNTKSVGKKFFRNLKNKHVIMLTVSLGLLVLIYNRNPEQLKTILFISTIALIFWFFTITKEEEYGIIPRNIAQQLALEDLKREIKENGCYPIGTTINPSGFCSLVKIGDLEESFTLKWWISFKLKTPTEPELDIVVKINPNTGETMGVQEFPMGFSGNEKEFKDVMYVFPKEIKDKKL